MELLAAERGGAGSVVTIVCLPRRFRPCGRVGGLRWWVGRREQRRTAHRGIGRKVVGPGDTHSTKMRHLSHYLSLAEAAEPSLMSGHREASLHNLGLEIHNIRAALEFGLGSAGVVANDGAAR